MNWEKLVEFLIAVAMMAVTVFLIPWIREKYGAVKAERLQAIYDIAVEAAEQLFGAGTGARKKQYAVEYLESQGVTVDDAMLETTVLKRTN